MSAGDKSALEEARSLKTKGNSYFLNGKYKEAITFYDKAINKCPEENNHEMSIFYQNRAASFEKLEMWPEVKYDCTKSLEYNLFYAKAYFRRAKAHEKTNDMLDCLNDAMVTLALEKLQNIQVFNNTKAYCERVSKSTATDALKRELENRMPELPSKEYIKRFFRAFSNDPVHGKVQNVDVPKGYIKAKMAFDSENFTDVITSCSEEINSTETYEHKFQAEALLLRGAFHSLSGNFKQGFLDLHAVISNRKANL